MNETQARANEVLSNLAPDTAVEQRLELLRDRCGYYPASRAKVVLKSSLAAYADALEDELRAALSTLELIASGVPTGDTWRSAADFMEFVAEVLDQGHVERPTHYGN